MSGAGPGLNALIGNLNQLHSSPLIADVRESIYDLQEELQRLKNATAGLSRYDSERLYSNFGSKEIRGIIDEAEDAVDAYMVLAALQKSKSWVTRISLHSKELKDAWRHILLITDKVNQINNKVKRARQSQNKPSVNRSETSSHQVSRIEEDHVVGFETPAKEVSKLLVQGDENLEVITIAGMPGLGKTTLAKMVYMDPAVEHEYKIRAFVYISRQYDKRDVQLQILASFSTMNDEVMQKNENDLEKYVFEQLKGKQYLIVLDDVWEPEDWDAFKGAFPKNDGQRCRVLITTTNAIVAEYANPINSDSVYLLDTLEEENSKELLQWKVFGKDTIIPDEVEEYVEDIVEVCEGIPLSIVLVAGVLVDHGDVDRVDWWKKVIEILLEDTSDGYEVIVENLPNKLKPCITYLGVFPQGYEIPVWKLVRLWISEGFIDEGENPKLELEDIAEQYLEELVQRNLVMVAQRRSNGKMKTCRLHDALRETCKEVADEENLFQEVNRQNLPFYLSGHSDLDSFRRLCINNSITAEYLSGPVSGKRVRSFLTFQKKLDNVDPKHVSDIQKAFKLLKVLELPSFSTDMSRLVLLKYLAVSSNISSIPSAFSGLWSLQTLIVRTTSETLKVEMDLWKMPHFRHFHTNSTASLPSPSLPSPDTKPQKSEETSEKEPSIRTLCTISTECCSKKVLDGAPKLKKLGIRGNLAKFFQSIGESDDKSKLQLGNLQDLENLKLINAIADSPSKLQSPPIQASYNPLMTKIKLTKTDQGENLKLNNADKNIKIQSLPSHTWFPPNLTKLTLVKTLLGGEEMATLGKLEKLEVLKLKKIPFQENTWITEMGGFLQLVHLYIGSTDLISLKVATVTLNQRFQETGGSRTAVAYFPSLKTLELNGCEKLEALPAELVKIPSLQSVVLRGTNSKLASSTKNLVQDINEPGRGGDKNNHLRLSVYPTHHLDTQSQNQVPEVADQQSQNQVPEVADQK